MHYDVIILASGKGVRADLGYNKVFYVMKDGKSVFEHSLSLFLADKDCKNIIVVTNEENIASIKDDERIIKTIGGKERKDSVYNGLKEVKSGYVLIHDAARPFFHEDTLKKLKEKLELCGAVCPGRMAVDTIKEVEDGKIIRTLDRSRIFQAETPQAFRSDLIKDCYERCRDVVFTDDASLAESLGHEVQILIDEHANPKLTKKEDFRDL